jgi:hypothetical protein
LIPLSDIAHLADLAFLRRLSESAVFTGNPKTANAIAKGFPHSLFAGYSQVCGSSVFGFGS